MSVLEPARRLAESDVVADCDDGYCCVFCGGAAHHPYGGTWQISHDPTCPWLSLPAIVRALEAAERVAAESPYYDSAICVFCDTNGIHGHDPDCLWQALVDALSGAAGADDQPAGGDDGFRVK